MEIRLSELGAVVRYAYWSDRRIREIASQNRIRLEPRLRWTLRSATLPILGSLEVTQNARTSTQSEIAERVESAIGRLAVQDFVNPPAARFAKGRGHVDFSHFAGTRCDQDGMVMYTETESSDGTRVAVCLFGSKSNAADYIGRKDNTEQGWTSSAAPAIEAYIRSCGKVNDSQWDDDQSLAVEAVKVAKKQGVNNDWERNKSQAWRRGFTLGHSDESEWLAEVYLDVVLDLDRWTFLPDDPACGIDRIVIAAPLWIRTPGVHEYIRYRDMRQVSGDQ